MRDDYLDRSWADNHHHLSIGFNKLIGAFMASMERLTAHQFDAPWDVKTTRRSSSAR